jgi:hypothetical protein
VGLLRHHVKLQRALKGRDEARMSFPLKVEATSRDIRILKILLRLMGSVTAAAFVAMLLPQDWMALVHERLGLGPFPRAPIVDYLARTIAGLYGFHGVLLLLVSTDPIRYSPIVTYISILNVTFGVMLIVIDFHAGLPIWWTLWEGPSIIVFGIAVMVVNRRMAGRGLSRT